MVFFLNLTAVGFLLSSCYTFFFVISPTHTLMPYLLPRLRSSILNCLLNTRMSITDITNITSRRPPFLSCILLEHTPSSCYPRHSDLIKALSFSLHLQKKLKLQTVSHHHYLFISHSLTTDTPNYSSLSSFLWQSLHLCALVHLVLFA